MGDDDLTLFRLVVRQVGGDVALDNREQKHISLRHR